MVIKQNDFPPEAILTGVKVAIEIIKNIDEIDDVLRDWYRELFPNHRYRRNKKKKIILLDELQIQLYDKVEYYGLATIKIGERRVITGLYNVTNQWLKNAHGLPVAAEGIGRLESKLAFSRYLHENGYFTTV